MAVPAERFSTARAQAERELLPLRLPARLVAGTSYEALGSAPRRSMVVTWWTASLPRSAVAMPPPAGFRGGSSSRSLACLPVGQVVRLRVGLGGPASAEGVRDASWQRRLEPRKVAPDVLDDLLLGKRLPVTNATGTSPQTASSVRRQVDVHRHQGGAPGRHDVVQFEHHVAVDADSGDAIAATHAVGRKRAHAPVHAISELAIGEPHLAIDDGKPIRERRRRTPEEGNGSKRRKRELSQTLHPR
jgi:hypothetical protein